MKISPLITAALLWAGNAAQAEDAPTAAGIAVKIHDSKGVSADSAENHLLEVVLFKSHTHFHLKISNTTKEGLVLWRPYCPQGDDAMAIEFRDPGAPDKVYRARTGFSYTGGMGIPKVFTLAAGDDLIVNVDFLSEWILPFALEADQTREWEMRAAYRSAPLTGEQQKLYGGLKLERTEKVWKGAAVSEWQKVRVINRTGKRLDDRRQ